MVYDIDAPSERLALLITSGKGMRLLREGVFFYAQFIIGAIMCRILKPVCLYMHCILATDGVMIRRCRAITQRLSCRTMEVVNGCGVTMPSMTLSWSSAITMNRSLREKVVQFLCILRDRDTFLRKGVLHWQNRTSLRSCVAALLVLRSVSLSNNSR